jgi:hypothetical protein
MAPWSVNITTLTYNLDASNPTHFGVEDGDKYVLPKRWYATTSVDGVISTGTKFPVFRTAKAKSPLVFRTSPAESRPGNRPR